MPPPDVARVRRGERRIGGERTMAAERELTRVLLHRPGYLEQVIERMGTDSFRDPELRRIFAAMVEHGADAGFDVLAGALSGDAVVLMQDLLEETGGLEHADEAVAGSLAAIHKGDLARRMEEIDSLMPLAGNEQKDALTQEKMQLVEELRSLGGGPWKQFR
jgi:replicative DNA helicase